MQVLLINEGYGRLTTGFQVAYKNKIRTILTTLAVPFFISVTRLCLLK